VTKVTLVLFTENLIFELMNFYDLFLKPYESYQNYQIVLEIIAASLGIASVFFSVKKNIWVFLKCQYQQHYRYL